MDLDIPNDIRNEDAPFAEALQYIRSSAAYVSHLFFRFCNQLLLLYSRQ